MTMKFRSNRKLGLGDIENILDEPVISATTLARRLTMTPRAMRRLIKKHRKELETLGPLITTPKRPKETS
jgi:hypothetical protein